MTAPTDSRWADVTALMGTGSSEAKASSSKRANGSASRAHIEVADENLQDLGENMM